MLLLSRAVKESMECTTQAEAGMRGPCSVVYVLARRYIHHDTYAQLQY